MNIRRKTVLLLFLYLSAKVIDLAIRGAFGYLTELNIQTIAFLVEMGLGVIFPMVILFQKKKRESVKWLFTAAACVVLDLMHLKLKY